MSRTTSSSRRTITSSKLGWFAAFDRQKQKTTDALGLYDLPL
jgi:hypothetical protein